jgi:uncharacterized protein (DUF1778 family)
LDDSAKRGTPLQVRLTQDERVVLEGKAASAGLTLSDLLRTSALSKMIVHRNDNVPIQLIGAMRAAARIFENAYEQGQALGWPPETLRALENAAREIELAFRKVHHDS